ncbi:unnamed protein product [Acanthoscelides obtectus]|uniref:Ubiquinol-cytochrome c chaperone domain-containing protein n=1 Tax=Acanthoscelides obtectus TaxID=200917 RepID=A0A9P0KL82_ACAOB|nr:unnamed protein product [Acanthoscelides obtectus]CAK1670301.1 Ubiquinol-cytochrome-c reductase complex assembly factor 1 [Acanthoscelides obtectus]
MRPQLLELSEQLQASLIAYDEGLQSDDVGLAGALWRRLYQMGDVDIHDLEALVKYVRQQISMLDSIPNEKIFRAEVNWA